MDKLERLKALDKAATPGDWEPKELNDYYHGGWSIYEIGAYCVDRKEDIDLITQYRNAVPRLIELVEMCERALGLAGNWMTEDMFYKKRGKALSAIKAFREE